MDKKVLYIISAVTVIIVVALGYAYYMNMPETPDDNDAISTPASPDTTDNKEIESEEPAQTSAIPGEYRDYSEEAVLATSGEKLLFFHAPWCPQCRSVETSIEQNGLPDDVTVFKVDYDTNQDLRQRYGVTIQTTFVLVDDSGNKIDSYVAYDEPNFASVERELLQ